MYKELERFLTLELDHPVVVDSIVNGEQAHTSNSYYYILTTTDGHAYQLGFSDHYNPNHRDDFIDLYRFYNNVDVNPLVAFHNIVSDLDNATGTNAYHNQQINHTIKYNLVECKPYDTQKLDAMLGQVAISKAFVSKAYIFESYTVDFHNCFLTAHFRDEKGEHFTSELYVNYYPIQKHVPLVDVYRIKQLVQEVGIQKAKRLYYGRKAKELDGLMLMHYLDTLSTSSPATEVEPAHHGMQTKPFMTFELQGLYQIYPQVNASHQSHLVNS